MSTPNTRPGGYAKQRRSQRILLAIPVLVTGKKADGGEFSERTKTVLVNSHGALIALKESVAQDQVLTLRNILTKDEIACRVIDINTSQLGEQEVGVQFANPCAHFWRVAFPRQTGIPVHRKLKSSVRRSLPAMLSSSIKNDNFPLALSRVSV